MFSCDDFRRDRLDVYNYSGSERYEEALETWKNGRIMIQTKYQ